MAVDLIQFVDSIAPSPTVRLDINDGTTWRTTSFAAPPPRLRRAVSQNAMRDGINVSSSTYDARTITLGLTLVHTSEDAKATELQKLARELDRADNFLRYQPSGNTKPVFFRLFRSDMSQLEQFTGTPSALAKPTIELLAEPFFYGLRETLGPFTINNDPAAGSNGLFFDITGVIGDVAAPLVLIDRSAWRSLAYLAVRQHGTPSNLTFRAQAESGTLSTDTTNPGGGPDAAMSGTGTNNFVRTSFATVATMTGRWSTTFGGLNADQHGRYRVVAVVRRSDATSDMQVSYSDGLVTGATVAIPKTTARQLVDLGIWATRSAVPDRLGGVVPSDLAGTVLSTVTFSAARSTGAGTLDWDFAAVLPADEALLIYGNGTAADSAGVDGMLDGANERFMYFGNGADPWVTGDIFRADASSLVGGFPTLAPGQAHRFYSLFLTASAGYKGMDKTASGSIEVHYWPRYLFVRPSTT